MRTVYVLQSESHPERTYVGVTDDLPRRLRGHNAGASAYTSKFRPWICAVAIQFADPIKADAFEVYLKSGSGRAFATRHF